MTDFFSMTEIDQLEERIKQLTTERTCDKKTIDSLSLENSLLKNQVSNTVARIKVLELELKIARLTVEKVELKDQNKSLRNRLGSLEGKE